MRNSDATPRAAERRHGEPAADGKKAAPRNEVWRRFAVTFFSILFGGVATIFAFLLLIDPYDTGRYPALLKPGIVDTDQRTASASRGRDPQFDAAIFGNSRAQLLDPEHLSEIAGLSFVQLTTPGSGPREHLTLLRYFLRHHPHPEAMVLGVDERWCGHDPSLPIIFPFPFWLYRGNFEYLAHLLSTRAVVMAQKRIQLAAGTVTPTDPRGYWDYETGRAWNFHPGNAQPSDEGPAVVKPADTYFPAIDELDRLLAELPPRTRFVIVMPPVHVSTLPRPGTQIAADLPACKAALKRVLADRPGGFLDFLVDGPISRAPENFMDPVHYRLNIARIIEGRIGLLLRAKTGRSDSIPCGGNPTEHSRHIVCRAVQTGSERSRRDGRGIVLAASRQVPVTATASLICPRPFSQRDAH